MDIKQAAAWVRIFTYWLVTELITVFVISFCCNHYILWIIVNDNPGNDLSDMHKTCIDGNERRGRGGKGITLERYPKNQLYEVKWTLWCPLWSRKRNTESMMYLSVRQCYGCCLCGCGHGVNNVMNGKCWFKSVTNWWRVIEKNVSWAPHWPCTWVRQGQTTGCCLGWSGGLTAQYCFSTGHKPYSPFTLHEKLL